MTKISIIGCGAIGTEIARAIEKKFIPAHLVAIYDIDKNKSCKLKSELKSVSVAKNLTEAIKKCDIVVEAASQKAVRQIAQIAIPLKKDIFILSVGALVTYPEILNKAKNANIQVLYPPGAIVGLDGLSAAKAGKIEYVTLTTRKPPKSFSKKLNLKKEKILFEGPAKKAVKKFPENINVAAVISLAGIGPEKTKVKIIADPSIRRNIHEIEVIGNFGKIYTRTENVPSKQNPKTSYLAALSAITTLREICRKKF